MARLWWAIAWYVLVAGPAAADPVEIRIGYLGPAGIRPSLSLVQHGAGNDGLAGARLAIEDNNTTGRFLDQRFVLDDVRLNDKDDAAIKTIRGCL